MSSEPKRSFELCRVAKQISFSELICEAISAEPKQNFELCRIAKAYA